VLQHKDSESIFVLFFLFLFVFFAQESMSSRSQESNASDCKSHLLCVSESAAQRDVSKDSSVQYAAGKSAPKHPGKAVLAGGISGQWFDSLMFALF
jgi:hypothetical protein